MPASNINVFVISGNLTHDPDLRETSTGHSVCELRVAVNASVKKDGKWESKPNFFQVNSWGGQGENCAKYLQKGSPVVVSGRLEWQKWEKDGKTNSRVVLVADNVQFGAKRDTAGAAAKAEEQKAVDDIPF